MAVKDGGQHRRGLRRWSKRCVEARNGLSPSWALLGWQRSVLSTLRRHFEMGFISSDTYAESVHTVATELYQVVRS